MPAAYAYHRAVRVEEACRLLAELPEARILAGGTDLLVDIDTGIRKARHVVGIQSIGELHDLEVDGDKIRIGACCTASEIEASDVIRRHLPELAEMVVVFASPQIRNRATVAGNICSAVACGDFPTVLMALGAAVELQSAGGKRSVALTEFFVGNRHTVRQDREMITHIRVPLKPESAAASYQKFRRRAANSLAVASVAAFVERDGDRCKNARIVLGAVGPTPIAAKKAEEALAGTSLDDKAIGRAADAARGEARPIDDIRSSAEYRRDLIRVLTMRAVKRAAERAGR